MYVGGDEDENIGLSCCTKGIRKESIANMVTSDWGRFNGPPSASAVQSRS